MGRILNSNGDDFLAPTPEEQDVAGFNADLADLDLNEGGEEDYEQIRSAHTDVDTQAETLLDEDGDTDGDAV